jgi:hypothetical protein
VANNYQQPHQHRDCTATRKEVRAHLVDEVIIAATDYRRLMAHYTVGQAELAGQGVPLDELVTRTWEQFAAAAAAEERLFAAVDALDDADGLRIVQQRE